MNKLQYRIKNVYGVDRMYPANESAQAICELTGAKTLQPSDLVIAQKLGFEMEQVM
jgi:hypothetical protein